MLRYPGRNGKLPTMIGHPLVRRVVGDYLAAIDAEAPRLVEALYLVGSVALDDFHPRSSDIDFVAITRKGLSVTDFAAVKRAHARLGSWHRRPRFDGCYVTWRELSQDPCLSGRGAEVVDGTPEFPIANGRSPVTWHTLASFGVTVRGPRREEIKIWTDQSTLRSWTHRTLEGYWGSWHRRARLPWTREGLSCLVPSGPVKSVLGVSRLHYTLTTGTITSKSAAGEYALRVFDKRWRSIVAECLRIRRGGPGAAEYRNPLARRSQALDFVLEIVEGARHLP